MKFKINKQTVILIMLTILILLALYARSYYFNSSSSENERATNVVKVYLQKTYPDKKFNVELKRFEFWNSLREFSITIDADFQKEYSILTEQDKITMDEYKNSIEVQE